MLDLAASAMDSLKADGTASAEQTVGLLQFEQKAGEYYNALDVRSKRIRSSSPLTAYTYQDIQSALRNSIHLIKRNRISPALLQNSLTQPSYTSVLRDTPVAPGVNTSASGSLRLETQVWNDIANLIAKLSPTPVSAQPITA